MVIIIKIDEPVSFKKRNKKNFFFKNPKFGTIALKFNKNYILENMYLTSLKKKIKFFFKKKKRNFSKIWFFLKKNYPISQKSKNSRMGKGKGIFERMVSRVNKNKIFLEFSNLNLILLKKLVISLKKKTNISTSLIFKKTKKIFFKKIDHSYYNFYRRS